MSASHDSLFPTGIMTDGAPISESQGTLYPAEIEIIQNSAALRRSQFTAGRTCAHRALLRLGVPESPILKGDHGEPLWPGDIVGSISHCHDYAVAAVGHRRDYMGIGLDIEPAEPLDKELHSQVCTPDEINSFDVLPQLNRHLLERIIFSAKETVYKCFFPLTGRFLDFGDISIMHGETPGEFRAALSGPIPSIQTQTSDLKGRYLLITDHIITAMALKNDRAGKQPASEPG